MPTAGTEESVHDSGIQRETACVMHCLVLDIAQYTGCAQSRLFSKSHVHGRIGLHMQIFICGNLLREITDVMVFPRRCTRM
ncbi:hypothetical protein GDO78_013535 [Eleutherodactylus coqui]|uniref:Uncharacterized protein n=1 Tax=Eleutherodactylus coqui TaxID=57060 RepID=A0A8J6K2H0_ELECQ|nr:hypothetical protein GDO78_013535 [Eleutherodactylus coqui]